MISIIIPAYGPPLFLKNTIESVKRQSFENWELIVVDDNNPGTAARQKTEELVSNCQKTDGRIIYLKHDRNRNGAVARNTGIEKAKGKYVAFLDSDDEYAPERLRRCYDIMESADPMIAGVYTGCEYRRNGEVYHIEKTVLTGNYLKETLACTFKFCTGSNIFVRKKVIDELQGFDETFIRHQDYEFLVRLFEKGYSLAAISEVLVVKNNENVNLPSVKKMIEVKKQYLDKFKPIINRLPLKEQNFVYHTQCVLVAEAALRAGDKNTAKEYYNKSKRYSSLTTQEWFRRFAFSILKMIGR